MNYMHYPHQQFTIQHNKLPTAPQMLNLIQHPITPSASYQIPRQARDVQVIFQTPNHERAHPALDAGSSNQPPNPATNPHMLNLIQHPITPSESYWILNQVQDVQVIFQTPNHERTHPALDAGPSKLSRPPHHKQPQTAIKYQNIII
jgi:hypothetical protein